MLEKVIETLGARRYRDYWMALCPFHDDARPSLRIDSKGYNCLACGARGPLRKLANALELGHVHAKPAPPSRGLNIFPRYSAIDEVIELLDKSQRSLSVAPQAVDYLRKRGLGTCYRRFGIGYTSGWYTVPVYGEEGDIVGAVGRSAPSMKGYTDHPYIVPDGQPNMPYVPDWDLWRRGKHVFVTFGIFDAITLAAMGFPALTPTLGKGSVDAAWFEEVRKPIFIVPDDGEEDKARSLACKLDWRGRIITLPYPDGCKDPNDYLQRGFAPLLEQHLFEAVV